MFSGLRPGEKLAEELYTTGENVAQTEHEKIVVVRNGVGQPATSPRLADLLEAAKSEDGLRIRHLLAEIVPGYDPDSRRKSSEVGEKRLEREMGAGTPRPSRSTSRL